VELPSFPSILLVTTLFRLALNVASTRAILTCGDAGRVISAFGNFVISGNYFAGAVVFLIITIIQLVVVTKGAERVAEVSARFTLDAMPGKQMSIDAELRAGHITLDEAIRRRANLSVESQFFGSMDGAMKFVKGDAIAGILISLINVIGGISTGTIMRNLSVSEAVQRYTILSIGDGLVSQIPSLIISVSAGIIITRISTIKKAGLGKEIFVNLTKRPLTILIAAVVAIIFSLLPHIPFLPFFLIGTSFIFAYRKLNNRIDEREPVREMIETTRQNTENQPAEQNTAESISSFAEPLSLIVSEGISREGSIGSAEVIVKDVLSTVRKRLLKRYGYRMPGVKVIKDDSEELFFTLSIYGVDIYTFRCEKDPLFAIRGRYSEGAITQLENFRYLYYSDGTDEEVFDLKMIMIEILFTQILKNIKDLFGIQETSALIEELSGKYPALVKEVIPRVIGVNTLSEILKNLLSEQLSIRNMKSILETIDRYAPFEKNPNLLSEFVRVSLARQSCMDFSEDGRMRVYILSQNINKIIYDSIANIQGEQVLSINPEDARRIIEAIKNAVKNSDCRPVIITDFELRRFIRKIIEYEMPFVGVLSLKEISPDVRIEPAGTIGI
ncbi:MAG: FHIPEP family type III secretion protein, partial [Myxococcota bacterium]